MSFGFSPGDIVTFVGLTSKVYHAWRSACGEYTDITGSLDSLMIVAGRIEAEASSPQSILIRNEEDAQDLKDIFANASTTLQELFTLVERFHSLGLGGSNARHWDRTRFGLKDLDDMRTKLTQHITVITAYLGTVGLGSLARIERNMDLLPEIKRAVDSMAAEMQAGRREDSVMTDYEDDHKEVWRQFRRELVGQGFTSDMIQQHKPAIVGHLQMLMEKGLLEEQQPFEADRVSLDSIKWNAVVDTDLRTASQPIEHGSRLCEDNLSDQTDQIKHFDETTGTDIDDVPHHRKRTSTGSINVDWLCASPAIYVDTTGVAYDRRLIESGLDTLTCGMSAIYVDAAGIARDRRRVLDSIDELFPPDVCCRSSSPDVANGNIYTHQYSSIESLCGDYEESGCESEPTIVGSRSESGDEHASTDPYLAPARMKRLSRKRGTVYRGRRLHRMIENARYFMNRAREPSQTRRSTRPTRRDRSRDVSQAINRK